MVLEPIRGKITVRVAHWVESPDRSARAVIAGFKTLFERLFDDGRDSKVLFHKELGADLELIKLSNRGGSAEPACEDIVLGVVRDHVLGDTVDNDGHGLLNETVLLESV